MSLAVLHSRALNGMDAPEVVVEVHLANGLPSFTILCTINFYFTYWLKNAQSSAITVKLH